MQPTKRDGSKDLQSQIIVIFANTGKDAHRSARKCEKRGGTQIAASSRKSFPCNTGGPTEAHKLESRGPQKPQTSSPYLYSSGRPLCSLLSLPGTICFPSHPLRYANSRELIRARTERQKERQGRENKTPFGTRSHTESRFRRGGTVPRAKFSTSWQSSRYSRARRFVRRVRCRQCRFGRGHTCPQTPPETR